MDGFRVTIITMLSSNTVLRNAACLGPPVKLSIQQTMQMLLQFVTILLFNIPNII